MTDRVQRHAGFTAVELLVVIGIMMILLGIAVPSVLPALRRGKINSAVNDITDCWRQARSLAITTPIPPAPAGAKPPHFGIIIDQTAGQQAYVAVVFGGQDGSTPPIWSRGMEPRDPSTWSVAGTPVLKHEFSRQLILLTTPVGGGAATTADRQIVLFAQYGSGLPIAPADVAAGQGLIAPPVSLGVSTPAVGASTVCPVVQVQTLDFSSAPSRRGFASLFSIYHAGFTSVQEL